MFGQEVEGRYSIGIHVSQDAGEKVVICADGHCGIARVVLEEVIEHGPANGLEIRTSIEVRICCVGLRIEVFEAGEANGLEYSPIFDVDGDANGDFQLLRPELYLMHAPVRG